MKRTLIFILAALLLLSCLAGCKNKPETAVSTEATAPQETSIFPTAPAEYANPFSDTPPEGDVFVTNLAFGQDIWPYYSYSLTLHLQVVSKHPLDTSEFSLTLPIRTSYRAEVNEIPVIPAPSQENDVGLNTFPYYLYQIYRGTDWKEYARLQQRLSSDDYSADPKAHEENRTARDGIALQYWQDYLSLTAKDLPVFYAYDVQIDFSACFGDDSLTTEECGRIELRLGDFETVLEGGSFRIHAEAPPVRNTKDDKWFGIRPGTLGPYQVTCDPWNGGVELVTGLMDLDAAEDITLTGISFYESRLEILQLNVRISSEDGGSVDFYWDGKSKVKVPAGSHLDVDAVVRDPQGSDSWEYAARSLLLMDYICGEEQGTHWTECILIRDPNPWETYAIWFDGLDVSSYYRDYSLVYDSDWRAEFTEAQP